MISGQLSPQGVQTTLRSCPFKPHTFISRVVIISWGTLADKRFFFFFHLRWKRVILQLHKKLHGGTRVQPNQNICSHAPETVCSKQSHKSGFWDLEKEREREWVRKEKALWRGNHIAMSLLRSPSVSCSSWIRGKEREGERKLRGKEEIYHSWTGVADAEVEWPGLPGGFKLHESKLKSVLLQLLLHF